MSQTDDHRREGAGADASAPRDSGERGDPLYAVTLWPHRSMTPTGFAWVIGLTAAFFAIPLISLAPSGIALGVLPFVLATLGLLYWFIMANYRAAQLHETLSLWPEAVAVTRYEPSGKVLSWEANPYWVEVTLHENAALENYLTLRGGGREIELGAFLAPEERKRLYGDLMRELRGLKREKSRDS